MIQIVKATIWEDSAPVCLARVLDAAGDAVTQAGITSISRSVYNVASPTTAVDGPTAINVATSVYDTLQTDNGWTIDSTGWNFRDVVPASICSSAEVTYRIEYKFTPSSGEAFWAIFEVTTKALYTS